jgi:iron complex outermembrane receptor protein
MKNKTFYIFCLLLPATGLQAADPAILVEDALLPEPAAQTWLPDDIELVPVSDGGELLRNIPGISGIRQGGRGIDPIIRGQKNNRLNILLDGAYVYGGCPNRMDPPTAYTSMNSYDSITVIKGSQSVVYGGGGSGGTVLFERRTPRFIRDEPFRAEAAAGYKSNSDTRQYGADVAAGNPDWFLRGIVDYTDANNYEDGDGNTVRSAYTNKEGVVILGYTPNADTRLDLSYEANREEDVLFAGAGMDSPYSDNNTTRLKFESGTPVGLLAGVKAELYYSRIDHLMDNYSLRPLLGPMKLRAPSTSDTGGGRMSGEILAANNMRWTIGADYQKSKRDADRYSGPATGGRPTNLQSILWPDADIGQTGLFAEFSRPLSDRDQLKAGVRYDYVDTSADRANEDANVPTMPGMSVQRSPDDLYDYYYNTRDTDHTEHNIGGFATLEHALAPGSAVYATLSRTVRTADATERYIASDNGMNAAMRWVGNPDLDPEAHHQLELGYTRNTRYWDSAVSVYYNNVSDYILQDRAHDQPGIQQDDSATIYRNVDAQFIGFEMEAGIRWASYWSSRATLAYVYAENTDDNNPIAQIPPLGGTLGLEYTRNDWNLGGLLRADASQHRVEDNPARNSGVDADTTSGWAVFDVFGSYEGLEHFTLAAGVSNVFDRTYAYHVNKANVDPFNPDAVQVNEPGREIWLRVSATF